MKLPRKTEYVLAAIAFIAIITTILVKIPVGDAVAKDNAFFVTIYDENNGTTVKTSMPDTVENILQRVGVTISNTDMTIPSRSTVVDSSATIRIIRSHPVLIIDGDLKKIFEVTKTEINDIFSEIGYQLTNCKKVSIIPNPYFLETGIVVAYHITPKDTCIALDINGIPLVAKWVGETERKTLNADMGRNYYLVTKEDGSIVERQETYYDLDMHKIMEFAKNWNGCNHSGNYNIRDDGVKIDDDGYVLVAAELSIYARCSVVDTSVGLGKVYDTGSFALANREQFDIATDWTHNNGI